MSSTQPSPEPTASFEVMLASAIRSAVWSDSVFSEHVVRDKLLAAHQKAIRQAVAAKNAAYGERNNLVAFMSKLFPSHLANDPKEPLWAVVCIHTPNGQMAWHIPLEEVGKFTHLTPQDNDWDGHTTKDKYRRLANLTPGEDV